MVALSCTATSMAHTVIHVRPDTYQTALGMQLTAPDSTRRHPMPTRKGRAAKSLRGVEGSSEPLDAVGASVWRDEEGRLRTGVGGLPTE